MDKNTSTWSATGGEPYPPANGYYSSIRYAIWSDGTNIYYSSGNSGQFVRDKATKTWKPKTWEGLPDDFPQDFITASRMWSDGENNYLSVRSNRDYNFVLDKETGAWKNKTWNGVSGITGDEIWTDGIDTYLAVYYSGNEDKKTHYILDKETSTWVGTSLTYPPYTHGAPWSDGALICVSGTNLVLMPSHKTYLRSDNEWLLIGGSTPQTITFIIKSGATYDSPVYTTCTAREGMTWGEYIYSSLNDKTFYDSEAKMTVTDKFIGIGTPYDVYLYDRTTIKVLATDTIVAGATYILAGK